MTKHRWIVAQEGTRETYNIPLGFHREGMLRSFYVDIWCRHGRSLLKRGPTGARALATHYNPELPPGVVKDFNGPAILDRTWQHFQRKKWSPTEAYLHYGRYGQWFSTKVRDCLAKEQLNPDTDCFFAYNSLCLETFELLRQRRILTVVDQVDGAEVEDDLIFQESEKWPDWASRASRPPKSFWNRVKAEWALADLVMVNSEWSQTMVVQQGVPKSKTIVVPLGIDPLPNRSSEPVKSEGTLKVLWLGSLILRKGIQYLAEAARQLLGENIEFILVGPIGVSDKAIETFPSNMKLLNRVTRDRVGEIYRQSHVFVLPTLSDGFAVTQLEAMARGLPVIATPNCGRVVTDGVDGCIVPACDSRSLADALSKLNHNRPLLREMSANALKTVRRYSLESAVKQIDSFALSHRANMP